VQAEDTIVWSLFLIALPESSTPKSASYTLKRPYVEREGDFATALLICTRACNGQEIPRAPMVSVDDGRDVFPEHDRAS
jgi:hypothetical protein